MPTPSWLPKAVPGAQLLVEIARGDDVRVSDPAAAGSGTMQVSFDAVEPSQLWLIDRIIVSSTSSTRTFCTVYDSDDVKPATIVGSTNAGNSDYDDTNEPYRIDSQHTVTVVWTGASDGAVGTARLQYRVTTSVFAQSQQ